MVVITRPCTFDGGNFREQMLNNAYINQYPNREDPGLSIPVIGDAFNTNSLDGKGLKAGGAIIIALLMVDGIKSNLGPPTCWNATNDGTNSIPSSEFSKFDRPIGQGFDQWRHFFADRGNGLPKVLFWIKEATKQDENHIVWYRIPRYNGMRIPYYNIAAYYITRNTVEPILKVTGGATTGTSNRFIFPSFNSVNTSGIASPAPDLYYGGRNENGTKYGSSFILGFTSFNFKVFNEGTSQEDALYQIGPEYVGEGVRYHASYGKDGLKKAYPVAFTGKVQYQAYCARADGGAILSNYVDCRPYPDNPNTPGDNSQNQNARASWATCAICVGGNSDLVVTPGEKSLYTPKLIAPGTFTTGGEGTEEVIF